MDTTKMSQPAPNEAKIQAIFEDFYTKAFADGILGHFFFGLDKQRIITFQTAFTCQMLGIPGATPYRGRGLKQAHADLPPFKRVHLMRRRHLMREVLEQHKVPADWCELWQAKEHALEALVTSGQSSTAQAQASCHKNKPTST
ncbi:MAG: hypothetical protein OXT67_13100 [Zetaproteobacteria bacterium]|nr:hypothetical protein [Zetaproteobacteria bacterium]